jgi:ligand-binding sensor domain-containing protein
LSSNTVELITEDLGGDIYAGTGRGLDRLDPATGRVRHYTTADGLASGSFLAALRDRTGALWFGTHNGLSRFVLALTSALRHFTRHQCAGVTSARFAPVMKATSASDRRRSKPEQIDRRSS